MDITFANRDPEATDSALITSQKVLATWRAVEALLPSGGGGGGGGNNVQIDGSGNVQIDGSGNVQID
ncbi:MAG TPA: hypothetical protein VM680_18610 [Verrucomicrobiae bacterium]|nr:hypothetical protein [Verrucomicrobiae bacterium]